MDRICVRCLLGDQAHHPGIHLHSHHLLDLLKQLHGQVSSPWSNLKNGVCGFQTGLINNGLHHHGISENVLTLAPEELDTCTRLCCEVAYQKSCSD